MESCFYGITLFIPCFYAVFGHPLGKNRLKISGKSGFVPLNLLNRLLTSNSFARFRLGVECPRTESPQPTPPNAPIKVSRRAPSRRHS